SLAKDDAGTILAWVNDIPEASSHLRLLRFCPQILPLDQPIKVVSQEGYSPRIGFDGASAFLVWIEDRNRIDSTVVGSHLDAQNTLLDAPPIVLSRSANAEREPAVAWDGQQF